MNNFAEKLEQVTIGADPEVFVRDDQGTVTSAIGTIGGSKEFPNPVRKGAIQEDNVLAEFNIDPAHTRGEFITNINTVFSELEKALNENHLHASIQTSHMFDQCELYGWGDKALEFGCGAEWDAWDEEIKPRPKGEETSLRTAGGHIHVGYYDPFQPANYSLARMLDFVLGVPSVLMDDDTRRRALYGHAGAIRHKPYGVEYRTLSNFWLASDELKAWVYEKTVWATQNLDKLDGFLEVCSAEWVQDIINTSNKAYASSLCHELGLEVA